LNAIESLQARYVDHYRDAINRLLLQNDTHEAGDTCLHWAFTVDDMKSKLRDCSEPLEKLIYKFMVDTYYHPSPDAHDTEETTNPCQRCLEEMETWRTQCEEEVRELKKMSSFFT
jgi:hypothetical protein